MDIFEALSHILSGTGRPNRSLDHDLALRINKRRDKAISDVAAQESLMTSKRCPIVGTVCMCFLSCAHFKWGRVSIYPDNTLFGEVIVSKPRCRLWK
jgi:hypothetical protein